MDLQELKRLADDPIWDQGSTSNIYSFPLPNDRNYIKLAKHLRMGIPKDQLFCLGFYLATKSPSSHVGPFKWAIDFLVPDGTEILAAYDGQIIEAIDHFNEWGTTEDFRDKLNYLTIRHHQGEYSQYCHLGLNSFQNTGLKVGDYVTRGQAIGRVGKTGWTDQDHLHFIVFKVGRIPGNPYDFYSLSIQFTKNKY
ncbi:MAG: hypothetical protein COX77_04610 [Candidatus Komeilibacteria bacterium CG_4_10_14_0_2_um_filter_37_10]|uniref:M23ase beta-sheet core domain-containing protein n=1 Tax=Candidatus Komeilibacteria bacterium CG_4_10_14_0_2_um_filter_37_10 TaxID=1974470 RepID=A0A2M7VDA6_9BACT|nr:MAG: hypothetical protein COX77_04610 [Candidatus Komeilibacteria bacterium CG_4_10_14_0_2_um_filter_37_10]PJA93586.1 MAG: hypothetical protein CO133_01135 [Candidatus Komeilibacteria bacterium CG_4_9_14_3_um_filter_37_5]